MKTIQRAVGPTAASSFYNPFNNGLSFRKQVFAVILLLLTVCMPGMAHAASIVSGQTLGGTITLTGQTDTWTFAASAGQAIVVRVGNASTTNTPFAPKIQLTTPVSTTQGTATGAAAAEIAVTATNSGTFTVSVSDNAGTHTGPYVLSLALSGGAVTVSPGFQGGPMTNGNMHTGTIIQGGLEEWTFNATAGEAVVVRVGEMTSTNSFTPWVRLYDPSGTRLGSSAGGFAAEISVHATNSGTFVVVIGDDNGALSGSGNYRLTLADNVDPVVITPGQEGGPMVNGAIETGTVLTGGLQLWTFTASPGEALIVRVGEITTTNSFTPWVRLYDPSGALLGSSAGAFAAEVTTRATNSGTFLVVIGDDNGALSGSGNYRLTLADNFDPVVVSPGDNGGPMTNAWMHLGTIATGDLDLWTFTATPGEALVVRVGEITTTNSFTPWVRLYDPSGALLGSSAGAAAAEVAVRATNSGTFLVVIADDNGALSGSGDYRLTLVDSVDPVVITPGDDGGPMTNGWMHTGTISTGDLDVWTFNATAGEGLVVRVGDMVSTNSFTPSVRLYDPSGVLLATGVGAFAGEASVRATNSGRFLVVVGDANGALSGSGAYRLTLADTADPVVITPGEDGGPMTNAFMHTGTLGTGDLDLWTFTASPGEVLLVRVGDIVSTNTFTPWVRLYDPSGVLLGSSAGGFAAEVSTRATNGGTFLVVIGDDNGNLSGSGAYRLTLADNFDPVVTAAGDEGGPMTNGLIQTGFMPTGDLDLWTFSAQKNQAIVLRVGTVTSTNSFTPGIRLYDPSGALLGFQAGGFAAEISTHATNSGTFLVVVGDDNGALSGNGNYQLVLAKTDGSLFTSPGDNGGSLINGVNPLGTIYPGDLDVYVFTDCKGEPVNLTLTKLTDTNSFTPWLRLYGPDGGLLGNVANATMDQINITTTNLGSFLVLVADGNGSLSGSGTYQLTTGGLSDGPKLCDPIVFGTNLDLSAIGGPTNGTYVLIQTTNITTPLSNWTPVVTNQFDQFGVFNLTNLFNPNVPRLFYDFTLP